MTLLCTNRIGSATLLTLNCTFQSGAISSNRLLISEFDFLLKKLPGIKFKIASKLGLVMSFFASNNQGLIRVPRTKGSEFCGQYLSVNISYTILTNICLHIPSKMTYSTGSTANWSFLIRVSESSNFYLERYDS